MSRPLTVVATIGPCSSTCYFPIQISNRSLVSYLNVLQAEAEELADIVGYRLDRYRFTPRPAAAINSLTGVDTKACLELDFDEITTKEQAEDYVNAIHKLTGDFAVPYV